MCYTRIEKGENMMLLKFGTPQIVFTSIFSVLLVLFIVYLCFVPLKSWITAVFGGAYIPTFKLLSMKNRGLNVAEIASAYVHIKKSKLDIKLNQIESLAQSGGNIAQVLKAMNLASDAGIFLTFELACAIELANHNIVEAVEGSINSKVLTVDDIRGFTKDDREIIACAKVSIKLDLNRYLDGLGLDDLKSSINAWILENISHCENYRNIMTDPNKTLIGNLDLRLISKKSMYTAIDMSIISVEVGRDLEAERQLQLAEKDRVYAQIEAERNKHAEEERELQMRTKTEAMKAEMLQAEAEVPRALRQAIKEGRFSVMDYYKLMNLQVDTALRRSILSEKNANNDFDEDGEGDLFE